MIAQGAPFLSFFLKDFKILFCRYEIEEIMRGLFVVTVVIVVGVFVCSAKAETDIQFNFKGAYCEG